MRLIYDVEIINVEDFIDEVEDDLVSLKEFL